MLSPETRYIRDRRHVLRHVGAILHNGCVCVLRMRRSGALIVYVPVSLVQLRDRYIH